MRTLTLLSLVLGAGACEGGTVSIEDDTAVTDTDVDTDTDTDVDTDTDTDTDPVDPVPACDEYGVSVGERLLVDHGSTVQAPVSLNTSQECGLDLRNGKVAGDVWVGPDGYPDVVICQGRTGELEGEQGILSGTVPLTRALLPDDLPDSGGEKVLEWSESATFTVDRVFDDLRVRTRGRLVIDGDVDILVEQTLELNNGTLELTPGSKLDLWVRDEALVIWGSQVNVDGDPASLRIHLLDSATLEVNQGSQLHARLRAPESQVTVSGRSSLLFGTAQARALDVVWGGQVQADPGLLCP